MKRQQFFRIRCGRALALAVALLALPFSACFEPESVTCQAGLMCPRGQRCAAKQMACLLTSCGDGIIQEGEVCDDGNILDGDGCNHDCTSDESCGNGIIDVKAGELCDDGNTRGGDGCSADCRSKETCGNGYTDYAAGEKCDDGNRVSGDGCSADCRSNETCGNGVPDYNIGEVCDDGNKQSGDGCSADCRSREQCGNGTRDVDEECDNKDANSDHGNCLKTCKLARCGDHFLDTELPIIEQCDDGGESAACNQNCTWNRCGDGIVNSSAGEQCDSLAALPTRNCTNICTVSFCGDGIVNPAAGEQCDNINGESSECNHNCTKSRCGDGILNLSSGEQCDSGGKDTKDCNKDCSLPRCGDGHLNPSAGEQCDDGKGGACGTCDATCHKVLFTHATGTIIAIPGSDIREIEAFSVSDGVTRVTFEFTKQAPIAGSESVPVYIDTNGSADSVAIAIKNAITDAVNTNRLYDLEVKASGHTVTLSHYTLGAFGNQPIIETVDDEKFKVNGMAGGMGVACQ